MQYNPSMFKAYDIRAVYPNDINEENIVNIIRAVYKFFYDKLHSKNEKFTVVLAYDMRLSGPSLLEVARKTLLDMGANIIEIGQVSTPTFYFAVSHYGYNCGIQITASHNPKEWNGMKMVFNGETGLIKIGKPTGMDDIKQMATDGVDFKASSKETIIKKEGILEDEVQEAIDLVGNPQIKKFKIVADPGNAMGSQYISALFDKVPGDLIKMNFELDGSFPVHQPDPLQPKNLVDLQKRVLEEKADVGIATDGDGDRLIFINDKGNVVPNTIITALIARELLKKYPGERIYFDIRYIYTPEKIVAENGGVSELTRVGHAYITEAMNKTHGIFAGESSGHMYFRANGNAEWNIPNILIVLKVLSEENKSLSEIEQELSRGYESGEFNFEVSNAAEILEKLKEKYHDGELMTIDGIAISYPRWRFGVRTSNTEPLLRLNVESYDKEIMEQKRDELIALVKSLAKEPHE